MLEPDFNPFPEFKTKRLLLRKITMEDAEDILFLRSDERVLQYIGREPDTTVEQAQNFIRVINANAGSGDGILWGIALLDDPSRIIGTICYWNMRKEHDRAEIGFVLHPQYWRQGIMKEALLRVIDYGFTELRLHSIEGQLDANNKSSAGILEATGFVREGYFREDFFFRGHYIDTAVYSLLKKE